MQLYKICSRNQSISFGLRMYLPLIVCKVHNPHLSIVDGDIETKGSLTLTLGCDKTLTGYVRINGGIRGYATNYEQ